MALGHLMPRRDWVFLGAVLVGLGPTPVAAGAGSPWETSFLAAPPAEVLDAARAAGKPAGAEALVLFEELVRTFDADGKSRKRYRQAYVVLTEAGVRDWGRIGAHWDGWHEEQPALRARVISADGKVSLLDPRTVETSGTGGGDADVYSDTRIVRAPLPAIAVGSVVELEVAEQERAPLFDAGVVGHFYFGSTVPVQKARLVLEAPATLPVKLVARGLPAVTRLHSERDGLQVTTFEGGPFAAVPEPPVGTPPEVVRVPGVGYATGASWNRVASRYAQIVDHQQGGTAGLEALARETIAGVKDRDGQIARLLARLVRDVRYTGVEFGDASIVPRPPMEVLDHRYGDCKDQALLLVALLRAVHIPGQVALLQAGQGPDVDEALPGLGAFNHAIVHVPGAHPLWIDPTDRFAPLGELPAGDQGRLALVAGADTRALVRTPRAGSAANLTRELREVRVEETGDARVQEHSEMFGVAARSMRGDYSTTARKKLEERLTEYVKRQYQAKALAKLDFSDPLDLGKPFSLDLTVEGAGIGSVWDDGAQVVVRRAAIFEQLPETLREPNSNPNGDGSKKDDPRSVDYVYANPFRYELRYRIVPPHGYAPAALPAAETVSFGPARLETTFAAGADGTVTATIRFDSGPPRLTPAELGAFREAMKKFLEGDAPIVRFRQTGMGLLAAGRVRQALAEIRALDAAHPGVVLHTVQLAEAYLRAGLGEAARRQARRAVALDPKSARAQRELGWVLEHDLIGRRLKAGADREGAERGYRAALALDPEDQVARESLAILLEYDVRGERTWPRARLPEVIELYARIRKAGVKDYDVNYVLALFRAERWREVISTGRSLAQLPAVRGLVLAATAMSQDTQAAADEAASLVSEASERPEALRVAALELLKARHYSQAAALFEEAARAHVNGAPLRIAAQQMRRVRPYEQTTFDRRDARQAALALMSAAMRLAFLDDPKASEELNALLAPEGRLQSTGQLRQQILGSMHVAGPQLFKGLPPLFLVDALGSASLTSEGDPRWAVRVRIPSSEGSLQAQELVMVPRQGTFHILCWGHDPVSLGREARRLARAGDLDGARYLLDWAVVGASLGTADDFLSGSALARVWAKGTRGGAEAIELATAVALAASPDGPAGIPLLTGCRAKPASEIAKVGCEMALVLALGQASRAEEALAVAADLHVRYAQSAWAFHQFIFRLRRAGRAAQARTLLEERMRAQPEDLAAPRTLAGMLSEGGELPAAEALYRRLINSSRPEAGDFNQLAWMALVRGDSSDASVDLARKSVELSGHRAAPALHTLAALLADAGKPEEAQATLVELLDVAARDQPEGGDWYVVGRIAELYDAKEAAIEAYRKVPHPATPAPLDTWGIVERRLRVLGQLPGR
jgi:transglutaminase-like putative cysteine protease/tetratricopeptide (TPR) repeat protein